MIGLSRDTKTQTKTAATALADWPVRIDWVPTRSSRLAVLRDDLLPGGTKQRACLPFLREKADLGVEEFVYASPFCGFAQVALALSASLLGVPCTVSCEEDKTSLRPYEKHAFTQLAESWGARIEMAASLGEAHERAGAYARERGAFEIPLGFNDPAFKRHYEKAVESIWFAVRAAVDQRGGQPIRRIWLPVGSGTLAQCVRRSVPDDVELRLVDVGVLRTDDSRIIASRELANSRYVRVDIPFHEPARVSTPVPSNLHYDSKLWPYLEQYGAEGDLWWNVAR